MQLRPYQTKAILEARQSLAKGNKNICICLSVGAGKSLICKEIIQSAINKNSKVGFFSFRTVLVEQIKNYFPNTNNIDIGTLQKFGKTETELYDLVIVDEKDFHQTKLKNNIKAKYMITLSGTPVDANGNVLEFDDIIEGVQLPDLIELGFAKQIKVMSISHVDTSGLKKQGSDFHKGQAFELMDKATVKKDIVNTYNKYCIGRRTLLFAIDTKHAESLKEEFLSNGIKCETIHSKKNNDNTLKNFEDGKFNLLINVAMISVGVDIPSINTIIFARPMCSIPLFIQCVGRATRKNGNDYALILDCAEVLKRTNHHPLQKLDFTKKKTQQKSDLCHCGGTLTTIEKEIIPIDSLSYTLRTIKQCNTCKNVIEDEQIKVINILQCKNCLQPIDRNISMQIKDKKIEFTYECGNCGELETVREVILTENELKEIEYTERMQRGDWVTVREMLKDSCRRCQYNWKYAERLLEYLQKSNKTIEESIEAIKDIDSKGHKISRLLYGYFD